MLCPRETLLLLFILVQHIIWAIFHSKELPQVAVWSWRLQRAPRWQAGRAGPREPYAGAGDAGQAGWDPFPRLDPASRALAFWLSSGSKTCQTTESGNPSAGSVPNETELGNLLGFLCQDLLEREQGKK